MFLLIFVVARQSARSDVTVYYDEAKQVVAGGCPMIDFFTAYSPPFPYLASLPLRFWDSAKSIIFLSVLIEIFSYPLWLRYGRRLFDDPTVRLACALYIFGPITAVNVPLAGQNHVWLSLSLAAAMLALVSGRSFASGLGLGVGIAAVKFLSLIFAPPLWVASQRRWSWTAGFVLLPLIVIGGWLALGADLAHNMSFHAQHVSSGNLPFVLTAVGLDINSPAILRIVNLVGLLVLTVIFLIPTLRWRGLNYRQANHMVALLLFTLLLISKKSFGLYFIMAAFPAWLCLCREMAGKPLLWAGFAMLSTLITCESSLWFRLMKQNDFRGVWSGAGEVTRGPAIVFLTVEIALLAAYIWSLWICWKAIGKDGTLPIFADSPLEPNSSRMSANL